MESLRARDLDQIEQNWGANGMKHILDGVKAKEADITPKYDRTRRRNPSSKKWPLLLSRANQ